MKYLKYIFFIFPALFIFLLSSCAGTNPEQTQAESMQKELSDSEIVIEKNNINLGEIPIMGGKVDAVFNFTNLGKSPIALYEAETSCMCTEAIVKSSDGVVSPIIQMRGHGETQANINQVLNSDETASLVATFDPLAHGPNALGEIKRDVFIKTNSSKTPLLRFSFQGKVIKGDKQEKIKNDISESLDSKKEVFEFDKKSYDFGVIKQSGGKVSHEFPFRYNGQETIKITGVPTSCACTSAKVKPTTLSTGDEGILTVKFNPNLHEEPNGKFFKTVSLITDPEMSEMPEVKIWVEIDLDLGKDAFELKSEHNDDLEEHDEGKYQSITPEVFDSMLQNKDFFLVDTHIPEQDHIEKTDEFIPYNEIVHANKLPQDKDTKIVLYCRSGSMSRAAAYQLAEEGYKNVYDLVGGKIAYDDFLELKK